ncbi:unnamed protein product, partial [Adineta steineri]
MSNAIETMNENHENYEMVENTTEGHPSLITTMYINHFCTITANNILNFRSSFTGALTILVLKYWWAAQANRKPATVITGIVVLESGCGTGPR